MKRLLSVLLLLISCVHAQETQRLMLSGQGPSDAVEWDFMVSGGRRAGVQARIPVPSQWEQHGFGAYDYGYTPMAGKNRESGQYRRSFTVPAEWRGQQVRIVFEGVMTDATVRVNGRPAGPTHQGGFYRFHYDITGLVRFGEVNSLEVLVHKMSANPLLEQAERNADYWVFGGIYRPVWLEARPAQAIEWTAIDARADGALRLKVHLAGKGTANQVRVRVLDRAGKPVGETLAATSGADGVAEVGGSIPGVSAWSAEEPNLYDFEISLLDGGNLVHRVRERGGFRSMELRPNEGLFINGTRVTLKGVNRHSFRPASGRALDPADCLEDLRLIKAMNMNAVRCSHYPPEKAFLEACDELGLYVINELCTWQKPAIDTPTARRLIGQMIRRDVNHPSILIWANGNEGGWNTEVDGDFAVWDIQRRPVIHPWEFSGGLQTKHYPDWNLLNQLLDGGQLFLPTEFLHGLYDGGHGAGLEDYWNAITSRPNGIGGFLWVLADEGLVRTDRGGRIDVDGNHAPDGILGPNHQLEDSFFTIKDIFNPVQIDMRRLPQDFDGRIEVSNRYDFRSLEGCRFRWLLRDSTRPAGPAGEIPAPAIPAQGRGTIQIPLPAEWRDFKTLELTAIDREGAELWTWAWPLRGPRADGGSQGGKVLMVRHKSMSGRREASAGGCQFVFSEQDGRLLGILAANQPVGIHNGPRITALGPQSHLSYAPLPEAPAGKVDFTNLEDGSLQITATGTCGLESFTWTLTRGGRLTLAYQYRPGEQPLYFHGITFDLDDSRVSDIAWTGQGPRRVWANRMRGTRHGLFAHPYRKLRVGEEFDYPVGPGYYAGVHEFRVSGPDGDWSARPLQDDTFVRIGTRDEGYPLVTWWPDGDFSVLHAIPGIGNKMHPPQRTGPQGEARIPPALVSGAVVFDLRPRFP
jgi:hypothetical protein